MRASVRGVGRTPRRADTPARTPARAIAVAAADPGPWARGTLARGGTVSTAWQAVLVLLAIVWLITVVDLVRRRLDRRRTVAWLLLVLLVPFAGALWYWVVRRPPDAFDGTRTTP